MSVVQLQSDWGNNLFLLSCKCTGWWVDTTCSDKSNQKSITQAELPTSQTWRKLNSPRILRLNSFNVYFQPNCCFLLIFAHPGHVTVENCRVIKTHNFAEGPHPTAEKQPSTAYVEERVPSFYQELSCSGNTLKVKCWLVLNVLWCTYLDRMNLWHIGQIRSIVEWPLPTWVLKDHRAWGSRSRWGGRSVGFRLYKNQKNSIMSKIFQCLKDVLGSRMKKQSYHRHLRFDRVKLFSIWV